MADDFISAVSSAAPAVGEGGGGIGSLKDFLDVKKLAPPGDLAGLKGDLTAMGDKFKDLGAKFKDSGAAQNMLGAMQVPKVPNLDAVPGGLSGLMASVKDQITSMTGTGSGPLGLPEVNDFMGAVTGSPEISALAGGPITAASILSGSGPDGSDTYSDVSGEYDGHGTGATFNVTVEDGVFTGIAVAAGGEGYVAGEQLTISGAILGGLSPENDLVISISSVGSTPLTSAQMASITAMVDKAESLFESAGIDIEIPATPPKVGLGKIMAAATSLQKIGSDVSGSNPMGPLKNMLTNDKFGDAMKCAMAEGKNNKLMAAAGIKPPQFNPFEGLPSAPDNTSSADAAKLLGGGS